MSSGEINWPERYRPENCAVHVRNEREMDAEPEQVWAWLIRARRWPEWYPNAANVRFIDGGGPDLVGNSRFKWRTFSVSITSQVEEYEPVTRIAWQAEAMGLDVYHAWLITPTDDGCTVLTEETQHGWLTRLSSLAMPNRMSKYHDIWLEELERKARTGPPD